MVVKCGDLDLSVYFNKVCTAWKIAVSKICNMPYPAHRWFLGPLMNQPHISYQLQKRCIRFLHNMKTRQNEIVLTCYRNAVRNANTPIGHNIAFLKNTLGIDIDSNEITQAPQMEWRWKQPADCGQDQKCTLLMNNVWYCQI